MRLFALTYNLLFITLKKREKVVTSLFMLEKIRKLVNLTIMGVLLFHFCFLKGYLRPKELFVMLLNFERKNGSNGPFVESQAKFE